INSIKNVGKLLGVVKVDANYTGIESICSKVNMGKEGGLFIIDDNSSILYSSLSSGHYNELYSLARNSSSPYLTTNMDGERILLNYKTIPGSNWTIITVNSIRELNRNASKTRNATFLMALACSMFAIIIVLVYTGSFLKPLMNIIRLMKEVKRGNLEVEFPEQRNDEIGYLGSSFNTMVLRINQMMAENTKLVKEVYEAKLLQKEAQINALYSQIQPHFINNTLNMISLLIQCGRQEQAVDNINKLSGLLRGMMHLDKDISLETEIGLLDSYLSIQSSRYNGRLEYNIDIDRKYGMFTIPALIFQPIVENSVVHGCEKRREKTLIEISVAAEGNDLIFSIRDNAGGIEPEALEKLREKLSGASVTDEEDGKQAAATFGNGIGLVNVNKRIKIRFGEAYGLSIESIPGKGTCVWVTLPKPAAVEGKI
ncbi:MAG: sensor histidine kinase, partial [Clostridiales bacterium]|nr:sensor histidine kinase [Clostridiales bacterium]